MKTKNDREAVIVVDLGFGDAGKGTMIDYLARSRGAHTVVRFNGGAQAGHNVVTPDGRHHTFSQFGAATFMPGVRTFLSRHMILNPLAMLVEADRLRDKGVNDAFARTTISAEALVITPFQRAANRLREISRGDGRHGSCGMGIGETASDALTLGRSVVRAGDLIDATALRRKLRWLQSHKRGQMRDTLARCAPFPAAADEIRWLEDETLVDDYVRKLEPFLGTSRIVADDWLGDALREPGCVLFEGAQGVLLDEWYGFNPYTTWSTCTFANALGLIAEHGYDGEVTKLGVVRAYQTRHGPGPFVTEDADLTRAVPDRHNRMDDWQRNFRVGWFDAVATRYAIAACKGVDALAVTGLDRISPREWRLCDGYWFPERPVGFCAFDEDSYGDGSHGYPASDILLGPERDLAYTTALGVLLMTAKPLCTVPPEPDMNLVIHRIAVTTRVAVRYASFGPTADDKRELF